MFYLKEIIMLNKVALKFFTLGVSNTLLSYLIYIMLLKFLKYEFAFTLSFIFSFFFTFYINHFYVFKPKKKRLMKNYLIIFMSYYLFSLLSLKLLINVIKVSESIAPLISIIIIFPLNFIITKFFFK